MFLRKAKSGIKKMRRCLLIFYFLCEHISCQIARIGSIKHKKYGKVNPLNPNTTKNQSVSKRLGKKKLSDANKVQKNAFATK